MTSSSAEYICPRCRGTGLADQYAGEDCEYCDGDGVINLVHLVPVDEEADTW